MDWLSASTPLIVGHRGASAEAPENTLAAFGLAAEQGAHGVEFDVRLSADGDAVLMHDATVDRTTDGSGSVAQMTTAALRRLDAGLGQSVPTLDEVFQAFGPSLLYIVELKSFGLRDNGLGVAVAERIAAYHLQNQVVVASFNPLALRRARRTLPQTTMVAVNWKHGPRWLRHFLTAADADHPHHTRVDEAYVRWARGRDYRVHVWTVDDPTEARRLAQLGVHAIVTNRPQLIRQALAVEN